MKNIPVATKIVLNIIFFVIYSIIGIILGDFLYGLILTSLNKPVAGSLDPVHSKIALISILVVLLISGLFRKYFYFPVFGKQELEIKQIEKKEKTYTQKVKQKEEIKKENEELQKDFEKEPKMKIYIDKEIK